MSLPLTASSDGTHVDVEVDRAVNQLGNLAKVVGGRIDMPTVSVSQVLVHMGAIEARDVVQMEDIHGSFRQAIEPFVDGPTFRIARAQNKRSRDELQQFGKVFQVTPDNLRELIRDDVVLELEEVIGAPKDNNRNIQRFRQLRDATTAS